MKTFRTVECGKRVCVLHMNQDCEKCKSQLVSAVRVIFTTTVRIVTKEDTSKMR
jgi:hypothetical protein